MSDAAEFALEAFIATHCFLIVERRIIAIVRNFCLKLRARVALDLLLRALSAAIIAPNFSALRRLLPQVVEAHNVRVGQICLHVQSNHPVLRAELLDTFFEFGEILLR